MPLQPLPEPDGYIGANDLDQDAGGEGWSRDQVQAIQRQAYEDGLRDAWNKINANLARDPAWRNGMVLATNLLADMLNASHQRDRSSEVQALQQSFVATMNDLRDNFGPDALKASQEGK